MYPYLFLIPNRFSDDTKFNGIFKITCELKKMDVKKSNIKGFCMIHWSMVEFKMAYGENVKSRDDSQRYEWKYDTGI